MVVAHSGVTARGLPGIKPGMRSPSVKLRICVDLSFADFTGFSAVLQCVENILLVLPNSYSQWCRSHSDLLLKEMCPQTPVAFPRV
jgi:hypothetical protein